MSWELGLQMVNHKELTDYINHAGGILTTHLDGLPKLTFIDDNFAFCHMFLPIILLMQVKSCNNVANK